MTFCNASMWPNFDDCKPAWLRLRVYFRLSLNHIRLLYTLGWMAANSFVLSVQPYAQVMHYDQCNQRE